MSFLLLSGVVLGLVILCFLGIGIGLLLGRRKTLQGCACEFDPDKARCGESGCGSCEHLPQESGRPDRT